MRLASMLRLYEATTSQTAKDVAAEIGLNESTYCRVKAGKMLDARNMAKLMVWMTSEARQNKGQS